MAMTMRMAATGGSCVVLSWFDTQSLSCCQERPRVLVWPRSRASNPVYGVEVGHLMGPVSGPNDGTWRTVGEWMGLGMVRQVWRPAAQPIHQSVAMSSRVVRMFGSDHGIVDGIADC